MSLESNFKKWPFYGTIEGRGGKLINKNGLKVSLLHLR